MILYPRAQLADELVAALLGKTVFSDAQNGLFLAAPRCTGKSTFLQNDLRPALEKRGVAAGAWPPVGAQINLDLNDL